MGLPQVLHRTKWSDIKGSERTSCCLYYVFYLLAILMRNFQLISEKDLIVPIHNESLCLGQLLHINFAIIPSKSASCWVLYWKHIIEPNLYIVRLVDCPHQMSPPPHEQWWLRPQSYIMRISKCACLQHGNLPPNTHQQILLIVLIYFMISPLGRY